ncbi:MAG: LptA/OstA family protein [Pseudomonadota bacterium]
MLALVVPAVLLDLFPVYAARAPTSAINIEGQNQRLNVNAGTTTWDDFKLRQAPDTVINSSKAEGTGLATGGNNGRWNLTGKVHIEYQTTILDADTAVVVFADGQIQSIEVHGKPASFSRPGKSEGARNQGTAEMIAYDGGARRLRFTGHTWYSFGPFEGTADKPMVYNLDTSEFFSENTDDSRVHMTVSPDKRVPTPRTPDRKTAE